MAWKIPFVDDFPNYKPPFRISFGDFPASHVWSSTVADLKNAVLSPALRPCCRQSKWQLRSTRPMTSVPMKVPWSSYMGFIWINEENNSWYVLWSSIFFWIPSMDWWPFSFRGKYSNSYSDHGTFDITMVWWMQTSQLHLGSWLSNVGASADVEILETLKQAARAEY